MFMCFVVLFVCVIVLITFWTLTQQLFVGIKCVLSALLKFRLYFFHLPFRWRLVDCSFG